MEETVQELHSPIGIIDEELLPPFGVVTEKVTPPNEVVDKKQPYQGALLKYVATPNLNDTTITTRQEFDQMVETYVIQIRYESIVNTPYLFVMP